MATSKNGQGKFILAAACMLMCFLLLAVGAPKAHAEGSGVTCMSLSEYAEQYPLQAAEWMREKEDDGICMAPAAMQRHWTDVCAMGFGLDGIPVACGTCHMPKTTDPATGASYTSHSPSFSPLENEAALNKCITCHSMLGVQSKEDMVSFTVGKQQELAARQAEVHALLNELYAALAEATANGGVEEATLEAARDAYVTANFYWNFEKGTAQHEDVGNQAAHNFKGSMEYLARAEALVRPAIDSLK